MELDNNKKETCDVNTDSTNYEKKSEESQPVQGNENNETCTESTTCTSNSIDITENNDKDEGKMEKKTDEMIPNEPPKVTFKKPILIIGPRKGHPTKVKTLSPNIVSEAFDSSEQQTNNDTKRELLFVMQKSEKPELSVETQKEKIALPYSEPLWSGKPQETYKLEVLKSGVILETIDLSQKSYHIVGRLPSCDISMAHPTISRYHAVVQYRANGDEKNGKGFYIYDLGSTHGTFWNGNRIKPKMYVRLHGGHMIKFGCSQRKFIVQAPSDDQEQESEFSVTELKEMRRLELEERERLEKQRLLEEKEEQRLQKEKEESEGIDWGMGEDADEETDLTENPYAQTNNEELFLDDPKKTLRGWFEREGFDLQYQTEDKGVGRFLCWVILPVDDMIGRSIRAEALVTGKKKEAVIQCALEACRILDRHGLLRQANHEAKKRKTRNWEEEDYYDSDEDNFLDRTGTIEKKREQRMKMAGKLETKAETYDSLLKKHSEITDKIASLENAIALQKLKQNEDDDTNVDALDAFMSTLDTSTLNKTEIRKMKMELLNLRKEEMQLLKLINIAKPANLPPLKPHVPNIIKKSKEDFKNLKSVIGHKKKLKPLIQKSETVSKPLEENDDDDNENQNEDITAEANEKIKEIHERKKTDNEKMYTLTNEEIDECEKNVESLTETESVTKNDAEERQEVEKDNVKRKKRNMKRNQQRLEKAAKDIQKGYDEDEYREDYSMWVPPQNQSGDGKTSLNEKFGY